MGSILRLSYLKFPPPTYQLFSSSPLECSLTISTDLGVYCSFDGDISELTLSVQLISLRPDPILTLPSTKPKSSSQRSVDHLQLKVLEPKGGVVRKDKLSYEVTFKTDRDYLEFHFKFLIDQQPCSVSDHNSEFQLVFKVVGDDSELPGGNLVDGIYFLSLYSNPIHFSKSNKHSEVGSRRYFNFNQPFLPKSLMGDSITVIERPFGKDLASHSWDCAWLGLNYLSELLFSTELDHFSPQLLEFRKSLISLSPAETIIELGTGCGLLSLGLGKLLVHFHYNQNAKPTKKLPPINLILSDLEPVLISCQRNIQSNMKLSNEPRLIRGIPFQSTGTPINLSLIPLDWEQPLSTKTFPSPKIILAFDVVYNDTAHIPLTTILKSLTSKVTNQSTFILLGYKPRSNLVERGFFVMIQRCFQLHNVESKFGLHLLLLIPQDNFRLNNKVNF